MNRIRVGIVLKAATLLLITPLFARTQETKLAVVHDGPTTIRFRYPSSWKSLQDHDGSTGIHVGRKAGPDGFSAGDSFYGTLLSRISFRFSIEPDAGCGKDEAKKELINGTEYGHFTSNENGGWENGTVATFYSAEVSGSCYVFTTLFNFRHDGNARRLTSSENVMLLNTMSEVMHSVQIEGADAPSLTIFRDAHRNVSFSYPAAWRTKPVFAIPPAILGGNSVSATVSTVGFIMPRTNLSSVSFTYVAVARPDATSCYAKANADVEEDEDKDWVTIGRSRYWHIRGAEGGGGGFQNHQIYVTYQRDAHQCLLFEEDMDFYKNYADEGGSAISDKTKQKVDSELAAVMNSVAIGSPGDMNGLR